MKKLWLLVFAAVLGSHLVFGAGISTCSQLEGMVVSADNELLNDIDCSSHGAFTPVGIYTGTFNGNNYTIRNVDITRTGYAGLFYRTSGAEIRDLYMDNITVDGSSSSGSLIGYSFDTDVTNVHVTNAVIEPAGTYTGGLVGDNRNGELFNVSVQGLVNNTGNSRTGGVVGYTTGALYVNHSFFNGTVIGTTQTAGVAGWANAVPLYNVGARGSVIGTNEIGGVTSYTTSTVDNCYFHGSIEASGAEVGGVVGDMRSSVSNCRSTGLLNNTGAAAATGGIAGYIATGNTLSDSYSTMTVVSGGSNVGGLVGDQRGTISNSYAAGAVSGSSGVGAIAGYNPGTISGSYFYNFSGNPDDCVGTSFGPEACTAEDNESYFFAVGNAPMSGWDYTASWDDVFNGTNHSPLIIEGLEAPVAGPCNPSLDVDWVISDAQVCDGVTRTTGNGSIIITSTGSLELLNGASLTTTGFPSIARATSGWRVMIERGSMLLMER